MRCRVGRNEFYDVVSGADPDCGAAWLQGHAGSYRWQWCPLHHPWVKQASFR
jgi:hypothetical protein